MIQFDRSRREAAEKCPRKRWWGYEYQGRGIEPVAKAPALELGGLVHELIEAALTGVLTCRNHNLTAEEVALGLALAGCWKLTRLAPFLEQYEVLEVEREEQAHLGDEVVLMARPDVLVRRRSDGNLFVVNFKTARRIDRTWREQWKYDQVTIGEVLAVEERLKEKLSGVIIEGLVKGDTGTMDGKYASPLTWAWRNETGKPHPKGNWTALWEWQDESGTHRLGKGWFKRQVWEHYPGGVEAWLKFLLTTNPEVLYEQVVTLEPILRNDREVQRWQEGVVGAEEHVRRHRNDILKYEAGLDSRFPMSTSSGNCLRPSRCPFFPICWEGADPGDAQLFKPRQVNHRTEVLVGSHE